MDEFGSGKWDGKKDLDIFDSDSDEEDEVSITTLDGEKVGESLRFPEAPVPDMPFNASKKLKKVKSGGFQSMGLFPELLRAILKLGYSVPTPIQRKAIPIALTGNDVVAMARTGSGKTAAFLIPIVQSLRAHSTKVGARSLILAPTRELALQTLKFAQQLCKLTDLRLCLLVGGENIEAQFGLLAQNPDIIIATPGRLMHHIAEIGMTLRSVEFLVFDEADRLFEMGFAPQINEIMKSMSEKRQTLLFSATLPSALAEFARAGLHNPTLIRLDVESKLSENLRMSFLVARLNDKPALVVYLLKDIIPKDQQTVVFAATKHHVEFLHALLKFASIDSTMIYGSMDQTARKINIAKFRAKKSHVLIVTDVAARGIDIPLLDNVINCDFPAKPKLFVHRVGRVARAGRIGYAYSLVASDELSYMVDLNLFLGRNVNTYLPDNGEEPDPDTPYFGSIPQDILDVESEWVKSQISASADLQGLERTMKNAYKLYHRTRTPPSPESVRRSKTMPDPPLHPLILKKVDQEKHSYLDLLKGIKKFRPSQTIFEAKMNNQGGTTEAVDVMNRKRAFHSSIISKQRLKQNGGVANNSAPPSHNNADEERSDGEVGEDIDTLPVVPAVRPKKKRKTSNFVDEEFFLSSYHAGNSYAEKGLAIKEQGITSDAIFDVAPDEAIEESKQKQRLKWDRKDMKYKKHTLENKLKVEKKFYEQWTKATHGRVQKEGEQEVPFKFSNAQRRLGLTDTIAGVNQEVHTKFKSKQLKPNQIVKSQKLKKWKEKNQQEARRKTRLHERHQKIKKGDVSFKAKHKHAGGAGKKSRKNK